jgi:hypothetical protein
MPRAGPIFIAAIACLPGVYAYAAPITEDVAPLTSPESFQIMTTAESEEHRAKMAELTGEARERYRNEQYRKLQERARAQGYELPETPPWGRTDLLPPAVPPALDEQHPSRQTAKNRANAATRAPAPEEPPQPHVPAPHKPPAPADSVTAPSDPALAAPKGASEARRAHRSALRRPIDEYMAERSTRSPDHPRGDNPEAVERMREADIARRKAMQARIDQAIEAMGQPRDFPPAYRAARPPISYPRKRGPYYPQCPWPLSY